jgi:hypothetical protein
MLDNLPALEIREGAPQVVGATGSPQNRQNLSL